MRHLIAAAAALIAIATALWQLESATAGLSIGRNHLGSIPVTVFQPDGGRAPVVVIAHGFAGSQQLMLPFAVTLARNGYMALTFDFPGHGQNPTPLPGGLGDYAALTRALQDTLGTVASFARTLPAGDGRLGVLGHSMASDIVVRYAEDHPEVHATVAVSLFYPNASADKPRNLLIIDGALEPSMLRDEARRIIGLSAGASARAGVTYGNFIDGSARRMALAGGVEHIGVLFSRESLAESLSWMNEAFARKGSGFLDARGGWIGLLYLGLVVLAWPLAKLLPRIASAPVGAGAGWRRLLPVAIIPAVLTPLVLWKLPGEILPLLLGDYLLLHFLIYGLLTGLGLWVYGWSQRKTETKRPASIGALAVVALAAGGYSTFVMGLPADRYLANFLPAPGRAPFIAAMLVGTLAYFIADEWLTRGAAARRGAYALTKACFLLSLLIAVALNPQKLFFLIIIVPAILVLFLVYGLFSNWVYRRTNHPVAGAFANALVFAWFIAVTFPLVGR